MRHQLVLQFPASTLGDFDQLVEFENQLCVLLSPSAVVDGHDFGAGEMNIFVLTDAPQEAFNLIKNSPVAEPLLKTMKAAYRSVTGEEYTTIWPPNAAGFRVA